METYEQLYEKYPNKEKVNISLFKVIWNYLERNENDRIKPHLFPNNGLSRIHQLMDVL